MRIAGLHLKNWKCFQGEHSVRLDAKMYALVARLGTDENRSNWLGKTSLLHSIAFALYGRHDFKTEDEFITRGEKSAEVRIEFDDGSVVTRSRQLGKSTRLWFRIDGRDLYGAEAQAEVIRRVGLDESDFVATCGFEQRQMARFVLCRPEERMSIVSGWLGLAPLEKAEEESRLKASKLYDQVEQIGHEIEVRRHVAREAAGDFAQIDGGILGKIGSLESQLAVARADLKVAQEEKYAASKIVAAHDAAERYEKIVVDGKRLAADAAEIGRQVEALDIVANEERYQQVVSASALARREVEQRRIVLRGSFDGHCPIADIDCPARTTINAGRVAARVAYERAVDVATAAAADERVATTERERAREILLRHREAIARLESARKSAVELRALAKGAKGKERPDLSRLAASEEDAQLRVLELERELSGFRQRADSIERAKKEVEELAAEQAAVDKQLAVAQEAVRIFGKNGAQKRIAEGALAQVEDMSCAMLADAGIDLSVAVRWSREGKGFASECPQCGAAFPSSLKVKECTRCHLARGPKLVHALDLVLSHKSGAAEDLGSIAFSLGASAWLRSARGSAWSTVLLDEPTGQLDVAHRTGFFVGASKMLAYAGFTQGILIAHSRTITDALPGRILIDSDGQRSSVRVVA